MVELMNFRPFSSFVTRVERFVRARVCIPLAGLIPNQSHEGWYKMSDYTEADMNQIVRGIGSPAPRGDIPEIQVHMQVKLLRRNTEK